MGKKTKGLTLIFLIIFFANCSKEEAIEGIITEHLQINFLRINSPRCILENSEGIPGNLICVKVPYKIEQGLSVAGVRVVVEGEDKIGDPVTVVNFVANESMVEFEYCILFNENEYSFFSVNLIDSKGIDSNPSEFRLQRPEGAN